jgi:hypothetical protein
VGKYLYATVLLLKTHKGMIYGWNMRELKLSVF